MNFFIFTLKLTVQLKRRPCLGISLATHEALYGQTWWLIQETGTGGTQGPSTHPNGESDRYQGAGTSRGGRNKGWGWNREAGRPMQRCSIMVANARMFCGTNSKLSWGMKERSIFLLSSIPPWVKGGPTKINSSTVWDSARVRLRGFLKESQL